MLYDPIAERRTSDRAGEAAGRATVPLRSFAPHDHLFFQGDASTGLFEIEHGTVVVYKLLSDGRRQVQQFAGSGDMIGLTLDPDHDLSAEALTHVTARYMPRAAFERAMQDDADFRRRVFGFVSSQLSMAREQAVLLGRKSALERVASFLLYLDSRLPEDSDGHIRLAMSRGDIADYLGLTLETVSRMLNRLKQMRVISLPRPTAFRVVQEDRLIDLAGEGDAEPLAHAAGCH